MTDEQSNSQNDKDSLKEILKRKEQEAKERACQTRDEQETGLSERPDGLLSE